MCSIWQSKINRRNIAHTCSRILLSLLGVIRRWMLLLLFGFTGWSYSWCLCCYYYYGFCGVLVCLWCLWRRHACIVDLFSSSSGSQINAGSITAPFFTCIINKRDGNLSALGYDTLNFPISIYPVFVSLSSGISLFTGGNYHSFTHPPHLHFPIRTMAFGFMNFRFTRHTRINSLSTRMSKENNYQKNASSAVMYPLSSPHPFAKEECLEMMMMIAVTYSKAEEAERKRHSRIN